MENKEENLNKEITADNQDVKEVVKNVESTPVDAKIDEPEIKCNGVEKPNNESSQETPNTLAQIATDQIGQVINNEPKIENAVVKDEEKIESGDPGTCTQDNIASNDNPEAAIAEPNSEDAVKCEENSALTEEAAEENSPPNTENKIRNQEDWAKRESQLLEKISMLQNQQDDNTNKGLQIQLKVRNEENSLLKAKIINLETELGAVLRKPNAKNKDIVSKIKKQHEDLLTKAKGMIFEKTKMIKNQELQIEALTTQVSSLKEVVTITKDLLEIRNLEATHLKERIDVMVLKTKAEKERHDLMTRKMDAATNLNMQLKKEYETQLKLFKELKQRYEEKFKVLQSKCDEPQTSSQ